MKRMNQMLIAILLLPAFACERSERLEMEPKDGVFTFSLDTKSAQDKEQTYRVLFTEANSKFMAEGTYCNEMISPGTGVMGTWLSPCNVNKDGLPVDSNGNPTSLADADKQSKYGLHYRAVNPIQGVNISVINPAVQVIKQGNGTYLQWNAEKEIYISNTCNVNYSGSWINVDQTKYYVYDHKGQDGDDLLQLIDRRAKIFFTIECGEQEQADLQKVQLNYVNTARWYFPGGFSNSNYTKKTEDLFDYETEGGEPLHLIKENVSWTNEGGKLCYVLPLDYESQQYQTMAPKLLITLGSDTPIVKEIEITQNLKPMFIYKLSVKVSSTTVIFKLMAKPWYNGGTDESSDDGWATIALGGDNIWEPGGIIGSKEWNTSLE